MILRFIRYILENLICCLKEVRLDVIIGGFRGSGLVKYKLVVNFIGEVLKPFSAGSPSQETHGAVLHRLRSPPILILKMDIVTAHNVLSSGIEEILGCVRSRPPLLIMRVRRYC